MFLMLFCTNSQPKINMSPQTAMHYGYQNHILKPPGIMEHIASGMSAFKTMSSFESPHWFYAHRGCKVFTLQDNSHEAIVGPEIWERVQELLEKSKGKEPMIKSTHLYGEAICGECGEVLLRRKNQMVNV